jgi:branched-chain amino acid transport system permease protein
LTLAAGRRLGGLRNLAGTDTPMYALLIVGILGFIGYERIWLHLPPEIFVLGLVFGALNALPALSLVLIFRLSRIVNFAQGDLGAFAAVLAGELLLVAHWPYWAALVAAVAASAVAAALVELSVVRYFFNAPRLILTVATIGVAQILAALQLIMPSFFGSQPLTADVFPDPFKFSYHIGVVTFHGAALSAVILAPVLALALFLFLRFTMTGAAIRASGEDLQRARSLGIPAKRLSTLMWVFAGLVSGVASILSAPVSGFSFGNLVGPGFLMRSIGPATIGGFRNLSLTFLASLAFGMVEQAVFFNTGRDGPVELAIFVVIMVALVLRAPAAGRRALAETTTYQLLSEVRPIPAVMRRLPEVQAMRRGLPLLIVAALVIVPLFLQPSQLNLAQAMLVYAMVGISLVVLSGWAGQISLGQWAIAGIGTFTAAQLYSNAHVDFLLAVVAGAVLGAAVSAVIGLPALRIGGYLLAVATLSFATAASAQLFTLSFIHIPSIIPRPMLFRHFNAWDERTFYYVVLGFFLFFFYIATNFRRSRAGRALVAMRDNEQAGAAYGFTPVKVKLTAFVVSGFIAAFAGGLYAFAERGAHWQSFPAQASLSLFAIVVFGGLGSPVGAVLGAIFIIGLQYFVLSGAASLLATGAGILVMLVVAPGGIGQLLYGLRDAILRAIARRHGMEVAALGGAEERTQPVITGPVLST